MPKLGDRKADLVAFLESVADDKACVVCYYCFLKDYLKMADRKSLYLASTDCKCDFASESDRGDSHDSQKGHVCLENLDCFEKNQ